MSTLDGKLFASEALTCFYVHRGKRRQMVRELSALFAMLLAGIILGCAQGAITRAVWRFIKRGFGFAVDLPAGIVPLQRTVGTQSQTNCDTTLTRFDSMRFVAQRLPQGR